MRAMKMKKAISISKLLPVVMTALALLFTGTAHAALLASPARPST